ncbi:hypothetical protein L1987_44182 [Smallanthus sonchifolius]|uniref:Uncharacterized protein n=1 Tax=Smallanthus sonchifolius TaxID=185202 RepID=A0ACB9GNL0_9ASTR|nr:hypothetical protein L1987_44182 [Smallanthus sonchifolius]
MGHCCSKGDRKDAGNKPHSTAGAKTHHRNPPSPVGASGSDTPVVSCPWQSRFPEGVTASSSPAGTPRRMFKWPFPLPSLARPIMSVIRKTAEDEEGKAGGDGKEGETPMDKNFGFPRNLRSKYVAVKIISKWI